MKVYVTTAGSYSDYRITNVFRNPEDADAYVRDHDSDGGVEEYELREKPVERRAWHSLYWNAGRPDAGRSPGRMSNPWESDEPRDYDDNPRHVEHHWHTQRAVSEDGPFDMRVLRVEGWDRDRVLKVYSEQRAQELARREGVS